MGHSMTHRWLKIGLITAILTITIPPDVEPFIIYASNTSDSSSASAQVATAVEIEQIFTKGLQAREGSMTVEYKGETKRLEKMLKQVINRAMTADPYTKYVVDRYIYSWRATHSSAQITFKVTYHETAEQTKYVDETVTNIVKHVVKPSMNDHKRVRVIHDYIVSNLQYDQSLTRYTAYEALQTGEAVCQGYALLTYKLLKEAGINNIIVEGTAGGELHAWNLVSIGEEWYHLDTTWDDPLSNSSQDVNYDYYLKTDQQMKSDHEWINKYPKALTKYKYSSE